MNIKNLIKTEIKNHTNLEYWGTEENINNENKIFDYVLDNNIVNQDLLNYGALLCKENTKYRNLKNIKICNTTLNKLKKTNKLGEVLIIGKPKIIKLQLN